VEDAVMGGPLERTVRRRLFQCTRFIFARASCLVALLLVVLPAFSARASADEAPGVVFVVGGIGGMDPLNKWAHYALPRGGVPHELFDYQWTHGRGHFLRDLQDLRHIAAKGAELAEVVRELKEADPGRPIYLVGHSAGAAIVLAAAERLPPVTVERVVLLSAAVSPTFDLRGALRGTRGQIVSFNSTMDRFYLDFCTRMFGTADRVYGPSAGLQGFVAPPDLDAEGRLLYGRLVQVPWKASQWIDGGRGGFHHSTCMPGFLSNEVAPLLRP
jgi:hypothetical protein